MVETWTDIDAHWPHLIVLGISVRVDFGLRVTTSITATVPVSTRSTAATRPVNTGHVQIHIIGYLNIWIVFFDPVICPEITSTLSTFFTRPQTEYHGVAGVVIGHCFCDSENHTRSCSVVVSPDTSSVGSAENMWIQHPTVHRWSDIKVGTKHHPFIRIYITKTISTDVVSFRVLSTSHQGVIGEPLRNHFKSKTFHRLNQVLCCVFVGNIALPCPTVKVAHSTVSSIRRVWRLI